LKEAKQRGGLSSVITKLKAASPLLWALYKMLLGNAPVPSPSPGIARITPPPTRTTYHITISTPEYHVNPPVSYNKVGQSLEPSTKSHDQSYYSPEQSSRYLINAHQLGHMKKKKKTTFSGFQNINTCREFNTREKR
jgi:hypothetical protein